MIKSLSIRNIKCFQKAEFKFSNLTLFCGENSVGKSTAIQCLLLLKQSHLRGSIERNEIQLVGELFSVGHIRDLFSTSPSDSQLQISIDGIDFNCDVREINRESYSLPITSNSPPEHAFFSGNLIYLCAERMGPRNSYEVAFDTSRIDLGIFGQYAMSVFSRLSLLPAKNQELGRRWLQASGEIVDSNQNVSNDFTLDILVKSVMRKIFGDFDLKAETHDTMDRVSNTYSTNSNFGQVRPVNTGFGISSTFPIIVGAFCLDVGDTLVVENPEVHLHPQAQSYLAQFLGMVALSGRQIIIETHSDHILNGFRLSSKKHSIADDDVAINSITKTGDVRSVKLIRIDRDGNLTALDAGFFDQIQRDLLSLF